MTILPFFIMSEAQAAAFREETIGDQNRLDPRLVDAGPQRGKWVLPERVIFDPAHEGRRDALRMLNVLNIETTTAWPVVESPED